MSEPDQPNAVLTGDLRDTGATTAPPLEESLAKRPDLRLARQYVDEAAAGARVEQANTKPDPELLLGYKRTAGFNTLIAGLQVELPFKNRNQGAIASSLAERSATELDLDAAIRSARNEIVIAQTEFNQKARLLTGTLPQIRAKAGDTVQIARAVYREGAGDLLRLLDAERTSLQAELLYVQTLVDYRSALIHLQTVTGMLP
jgi:cobalt-zinc-cadmium efflux system outer membrane protein